MKKVLKEILSWSLYMLGAIVFVMILNTFIIQPTQVQGESMEATLFDKDRVIINKLPHTFGSSYSYGDIVVIDSRVDRKRSFFDEITFNFRNNLITFLITGKQDDFYWIKRIIGKEGDVIEFRDGKVYRNDVLLEEEYVKEEIEYYLDEIIVVPKGEVFVMGDNRKVSKDSRHIGTVPLDHVIGKYLLKIK